MGKMNQSDPFARFLVPPPNETSQQRAERERKEAEAQRASDRIDEELKLEKAALKKHQKGLVKVLLLGQSESGKSTTLKNFRMKYATEAWKQERASWRAVIQLNLIRSVITIVETLEAEMANDPISTPEESDMSAEALFRPSLDAPACEPEAAQQPPLDLLTNKHLILKLRLCPLQRVERELKRRLGAGTEEDMGNGGTDVLSDTTLSIKRRRKEFGVRGWKLALNNLVKHGGGVQQNTDDQGRGVDDETEVIVGCKEDIKALWMDKAVRTVLAKRRMRVEDSAGFFLDDIDRIATRTYEPSDYDIVRARLRTVGVQEYKIQFGQDIGKRGDNDRTSIFGHEWVIYDVGGSRTLRNAWLPYFEGVNAIIFLAPISCFDERLLEDPNVNRLEDSFLLWRNICSSKLLSKATMILFLNKCDILRRKLQSGTVVKNFLPSYGNRPNDASNVIKYLRQKFRDIVHEVSPEPRNKYFYATSVTDTKSTAVTLSTVRDSIIREQLKTAEFL